MLQTVYKEKIHCFGYHQKWYLAEVCDQNYGI